MTAVEYPDVPVNADGLATEAHIASHHVRASGLSGELTLCGKLIIYKTWQGVAPDAPRCATCERLDA